MKRLDDVWEFRTSLDSETDRGCALMAAAFLDSELEMMLRSVVVDDKNAADGLFDQARPLGTFSSRIDTSYLLGLISPSARRDLHIIRKIRNDFGHVHRPLSFDDESIANRCRELTFCLKPESDSSRKRFVSAAVGVLAMVHTAADVRPRLKARADPDLDAARLRQQVLISAVKQAIQDQAGDDA